MKYQRLFSLVLAFFVLVPPLAFSQESNCNQKLKIGIITGLSGESQSWGESIRDGFELGLEDAGCDQMLRFYEDDQFLSKKTVSAYRKLVDQRGVNAVVVSSSNAGNVIAPLAEKDKIPLFAWASDTKVAKGRKYAIRTWSSGDDEAALLAEQAKEESFERIAMFSSVHDYSLAVERGFRRRIPAEKIPLTREFDASAKDFRTEVLSLRQDSIDAVFACLVLPGASGILARQMREQGLALPIFGCQAMEFQANFSESRGSLEGAVFVTAGIDEDFRKRFMKRFGETGTIGGAAIHYDLASILSRTKSSGEGLVKEVLDGDWESSALMKIESYLKEDDQALRVQLVLRKFDEKGNAGPLAKN